MSSKILRKDLFPTPLFSREVPGFPELNPGFAEKIYEIKKNETGVVKSNVFGWHSITSVLLLDEFRVLKDIIDETANTIIKDLGFNIQLGLGASWAMINQTNASNQIHDHPNSVLSGVYYVNVPEPVSQIRFYDPRHVKTFYIPDNITLNDYSSEVAAYVPKAGTFLLFPSWLKHSVAPNLSDEDRISVSFNYSELKQIPKDTLN
jgi:uncharacterized protein (TIGR02466 family)